LTEPQLPQTRSAVSAALRQKLGGESSVHAYYDEGETNVVAIVEADATPAPSLTTYATASLHDCVNRLDDRDVRVELFVVGLRECSELGKLLATAAFCVAKNQWLVAPGVVFPNIVSDYFPTAAVKHLMWVEPLDFANLSGMRVDGLEVPLFPLQGVPITDAEYGLLRANGFDALEQALSAADAAYYDVDRPSVM
jgi:hypothetical protein